MDRGHADLTKVILPQTRSRRRRIGLVLTMAGVSDGHNGPI